MWWFALVGCGSPCAPSASPTLEIGAGRFGYAPLAPGDPVPIVYGPQGGFHLDLALSATGFDAFEVVSGVLVGTVDGEERAFGEPWFDLACDRSARAQRAWGLRLVLDGIPPEFDGAPLVVDAEVTDRRGVSASASIELVPTDPF